MKLGLNLISVRKPIGIFTWHQDDIAKRLGSHGEDALCDVSRRTLRMRTAKLCFRLKHFLEAGLIPPLCLKYELIDSSGQVCSTKKMLPKLGL